MGKSCTPAYKIFLYAPRSVQLVRVMENVIYGSFEHTKIVSFDNSWSEITNLKLSWLYRDAECCNFFSKTAKSCTQSPKMHLTTEMIVLNYYFTKSGSEIFNMIFLELYQHAECLDVCQHSPKWMRETLFKVFSLNLVQRFRIWNLRDSIGMLSVVIFVAKLRKVVRSPQRCI